MGEFLDPVVMTFVGVVSGIALVVALIDVILMLQSKGTARLAGLLPAVDSVLVIAGFIMIVGTCMIIQHTMYYFAATGFGWRWDGAINSTIVVPLNIARSYVMEMIRATLSILITWFSGVFFFEVWCLLRILDRKSAQKLPVAS